MGLRFIMLAVILCVIQNNMYAGGIKDESAFPDPEIITDLPDSLTGEFMIFPVLKTIIIFPNNKFLLSGKKIVTLF